MEVAYRTKVPDNDKEIRVFISTSEGQFGPGLGGDIVQHTKEVLMRELQETYKKFRIRIEIVNDGPDRAYINVFVKKELQVNDPNINKSVDNIIARIKALKKAGHIKEITNVLF